MSSPQPKVPLKDHCSVIYNGTLYTYQPDAFQSLDLKQGGTWSQLSMGVSTNGSTCVQGAVDNDPSLIVIGGFTSTQNYHGVQHYSFHQKTWKTDSPADGVATNRLSHGAAFLQQSSQILTYAGSQDMNKLPSSQTFLISTKSPYDVQAFSSDAPPAVDPLVIPYNATHALMLGGDPTNTKVFTFGPDEGWQQMNVGLQNGLQDSSKVQASLVDGSDGSKVLEIMDMSVSPNQVSSVLLQNATSSPAKTSRSYIPSPHHPSKRRKRDTSLANRPAYNNTLAPQNSRTGFSMASDPSTGLVVASGGNSQAPIAMFNQTSNQWIDPSKFFGKEPIPNGGATPSSTSTTPTSSASAVPSAVAAANNTVRNRSLTILGGVLGGVFGLALLLILLLLLSRCLRKRKERRRQQRASEYTMKDKEEMDFADVSADFMKEAGGSMVAVNHQQNRSDRSDGSARMKAADRSGAASSQSKRALLHAKGDSAGSTHSFLSRGTKSPDKSPPLISAPILGPSLTTTTARALGPPVPDPRTEPRNADTGWSTYFTNNETFPTRSPPRTEENRPNTYLSSAHTQSDYESSRVPSSHPHESAEVEPLSFSASQSRLPPKARAVSPTGFPNPPGLGLALTHRVGGPHRSESPTHSNLDMVSDIDEEDELHHHYSHGESSGHESWTPVATSGERGSTWTDDRPASAVHNDLYTLPGQRVQIPDFPMPNSAHASVVNSPVTSPLNSPPMPQSAFADLPSSKGMRNVATRDFTRTNSGRQHALPDVRTGMQRVTPSSTPLTSPNPNDGPPEVRAFPRSREQRGSRGRGGSQTEDMSWLNLGTSAEGGNMYFPGREYPSR